MTELAQRIKKYRTDKGITQRELADKLNVSQNAIYNWENGKREPSIDMIRKIATVLEVYTYDLLYDSELATEKKQQDLAEIGLNFISNGYLELPDDEDVVNAILLRNFSRLNRLGKTEAFKRIEELTEIPRYTQNGTGDNTEE